MFMLSFPAPGSQPILAARFPGVFALADLILSSPLNDLFMRYIDLSPQYRAGFLIGFKPPLSSHFTVFLRLKTVEIFAALAPGVFWRIDAITRGLPAFN